jgi:membrane protease YdiL (CAAX protease family)
MSIVLAADTDLMPPAMLAVWAVASVVALGLLKFAGSFQRRPDATLQRLFAGDPILPLFWNILTAAGVYVLSSGVAVAFIAAMEGKTDFKDPKDLLVGGNLVAVMIVMQVSAFISLLAGVSFIQDGFTKVGLDRSPLQGIKYGAALILAAMPLVLLTMGAATWTYHQVGYKPPEAHELLEAIKPNDHLLRFAGIFAAVVVAPLTEELFFRGHLLPLLRRTFSNWLTPTPPLPPPIPMPMTAPPGIPFDMQAMYPPIPPSPIAYYAPPKPLIQQSFVPSLLAILVTSGLFALVHPAWSWPPIFVLALALGFAYERTGNLWVPIVMHACFNGLMTSMFLSQM